MNVWESMSETLTHEEATRYWSPISPLPYIPKLKGAGKKILAISGRYDPTFWPQFTDSFLATMRRHNVALRNGVVALRALFAGCRAVQIHRRISLWDLPGACPSRRRIRPEQGNRAWHLAGMHGCRAGGYMESLSPQPAGKNSLACQREALCIG